jgi:hypothetical protein
MIRIWCTLRDIEVNIVDDSNSMVPTRTGLNHPLFVLPSHLLQSLYFAAPELLNAKVYTSIFGRLVDLRVLVQLRFR